jgi:hypothetical protein
MPDNHVRIPSRKSGSTCFREWLAEYFPEEIGTFSVRNQRALVEVLQRRPELTDLYVIIPEWLINFLAKSAQFFEEGAAKLDIRKNLQEEKLQRRNRGPKSKAERTAARHEKMRSAIEQGITDRDELFRHMWNEFPELMKGCATARNMMNAFRRSQKTQR